MIIAIGIGVPVSAPQAKEGKRPRDRWNFQFKDFVIGAWWGPGPTQAEVKLYKEAGFNVVMIGRYMQLDNYGDANRGLKELDLAHRYGLGVMFDTYTKNDRPWGGKVGPTDDHPFHHPASLPELQWLYEQFGHHPALIGFMIGDDQGSMSGRSIACTEFLYAQKGPHRMPWLCGWISPANLAEHNNPIVNPQIYPTLYSWSLPAEELARQYAVAYAGYSRQCRDRGLIFWPMFNVAPPARDTIVSDSLVRFPACAALAYGAEGIWYFTYNGNGLQREGTYPTEEEARQALTPLYPVAKEINPRIAAWGRRVMGRTSTGLFGTAFGAKLPAWPFQEDTPALRAAEALVSPEKGKLIETMSEDLLAGILTRAGRKPLVMVVDCRASKTFGGLPPREVTVRFAPAVSRIQALAEKGGPTIRGNEAKLTLQAGGGQMLELDGKGLDTLCSTKAIYAPPAPAREESARRALSQADLSGIRAARLRIDVFGSNGEPPYQEKYITLNGHRLARIPANGTDSWTLAVVDFSPEQRAWIRESNEIVVRNEGGDAWKFRNVTLAVQLSDGAWVRTDTDPTTYSAPGWAHSEGRTWGEDGVAGPIRLSFARR
jgi:hypothetical protein